MDLTITIYFIKGNVSDTESNIYNRSEIYANAILSDFPNHKKVMYENKGGAKTLDYIILESSATRFHTMEQFLSFFCTAYKSLLRVVYKIKYETSFNTEYKYYYEIGSYVESCLYLKKTIDLDTDEDMTSDNRMYELYHYKKRRVDKEIADLQRDSYKNSLMTDLERKNKIELLQNESNRCIFYMENYAPKNHFPFEGKHGDFGFGIPTADFMKEKSKESRQTRKKRVAQDDEDEGIICPSRFDSNGFKDMIARSPSQYRMINAIAKDITYGFDNEGVFTYFTISGERKDYMPTIEEIAKYYDAKINEYCPGQTIDDKEAYMKGFGSNSTWNNSQKGVIPTFIEKKGRKILLMDLKLCHGNVMTAIEEMLILHQVDDAYSQKKIPLDNKNLIMIFVGDYQIAENDDASVMKKKMIEKKVSSVLANELLKSDIIIGNKESVYCTFKRFKRELASIAPDTIFTSDAVAALFLSNMSFDNEYTLDKSFVDKDLAEYKNQTGCLIPKKVRYDVANNLKQEISERYLFIGDTKELKKKRNYFFMEQVPSKKELDICDPDVIFLLEEEANEDSINKLKDMLSSIHLDVPIFINFTQKSDFYAISRLVLDYAITGFHFGPIEEYLKDAISDLKTIFLSEYLHHTSTKLCIAKSYSLKGNTLVINLSVSYKKVKPSIAIPYIDADYYTGYQMSDFIGDEEIVKQIIELKKIFMDYRASKRLGKKVSLNNIILYGEAGTGKTLLLRIFASDLFYTLSLNVAELCGLDANKAIQTLKSLFEEGRKVSKYGPVLICLDECDVISKKRVGNPDFSSVLLNTFLNEINGFSDQTTGKYPSIVMATTNRNIYEYCDDAFLRRVPIQIKVGLPNKDTRVSILRYYLKQYDVELEEAVITNLCMELQDKSPSYIKSLVETTKLYDTKDIVEEFLRKEFGMKIDYTDEMLNTTAIHEVGHLICSSANRLPEVVRLIFRSNTLGYARYKEEYYERPEDYQERIVASLGGAAAEKVKLGCFGAGCKKDLEVAIQLSEAYCRYFGYEGKLFSNYESEAFKHAVNATLNDCMDLAIEKVKKNEATLDILVTKIQASLELTAEDIKAVIKNR